MPKPNTKCWSCGQDTMVSFKKVGNGWLKCSNCGATHMPKQTESKNIAMLEETWQDEEGDRHYASSPIRKSKTSARA